MQAQRDKDVCACWSTLLGKVSTVIKEDFQRKEIQQAMLWPTQQSPQILEFDFDSYKQPPQQEFSFQIQHFCGDEHEQHNFEQLKNELQHGQSASKAHTNIDKNKSNDQIKYMDSHDFYGPAGQVQSILDSQFINLQQMEEEEPEPRLNQNEYFDGENPASEKNTNMPKFLLRLFFRHYRSAKACEAGHLDQSAVKFINDYQQRYLKRPKAFYKLDQLIDVLRLQEWIKEKNIGLRRRMNAILKAKGRLEILKSSQLKLKTSYLNAAKVYSLRCANQSLSQRLQSK